MVPAHFLRLDALPRTHNGKLDRKALPPPQSTDLSLDSREYVAPRTDLEISLASAWAQVLRVPRVGITDSFFDLGGNSLSVLKLIYEMEQACGIKMALGDVFGSPTIAGLVSRLGRDAAKQASVVVPLQPKGDGIPIYCICGINIYRDFAQSIGTSEPVFGVFVEEEQAIVNQIAAGGRPTISIEKLVDAYSRAIARFRPQGPFRLAGVSFGGVLAMELASRLRARGEKVDLVFLFDTVLPQGLHHSWIKWFYFALIDVITGRGWARLRRRYARLRDRFAKRTPGQNVDEGVPYVDDAFTARQDAAFFEACSQWKGHGSVIDFPVVLFRSSDHPDWGRHITFDEDYGWRHFAGDRLSVVEVPGDHLGQLGKPHVATLGREARRFLDLAAAE
jgi:thioesterase domain-containing protein/acyl carrier protein